VFNETGIFKEEALFKQIKDKTNIIAEVHMLKNAIPTQWKLKIAKDPCRLYVKPAIMPKLYIYGKSVDVNAIQSSRTIYLWLMQINKKNTLYPILLEGNISK
jgi:hypothetical protein